MRLSHNKVRILCVGRIKEKYLREGIGMYAKRISPFADCEIIEIKDSDKNKESEKIMEKMNNSTYILDEEGDQFDSIEFAKLISENTRISFAIGGADGLSDKLKENGRKISLSKMTLTHEMVRLILIEQIYRAFMINNNRKYHR